MRKIIVSEEIFLNLPNKDKARICQYIALGVVEVKNTKELEERNMKEKRE